MAAGIYRSDPDATPDAEFEPGAYRHLVVGNRGRLLDARRTPVTITAVALETGTFEVRVDAFEDQGASWQLPVEDVGRFQFARGSATAHASVIAAIERAVERFDRELTIECDAAVRDETIRLIRAERDAIRAWLALRDAPRIDIAGHVASRNGHPHLFSLLETYTEERGIAELERDVTRAWVSNPAAGEIVKGHAIVLAELGMCPYRGKIVRDPELFAAPRSKPDRAAHLITRLAFTQALWSSWDQCCVMLYRGAAVDGPFPSRPPASFVSATMSSDVAVSHYAGGPTTQAAVLWRQRVPVTRLLMTFLETREMNSRFHEAEAVLIGDPSNQAF